MTATPVPKMAGSAKTRLALALVVALFFIWGFTMNLLNALNVPFKVYLNLSTTESTLLQAAYFTGYFVMAIPAASIAKRHGYKAGIVFGLAVFAMGALISIPASIAMSYAVFLLAMFVLACGAATLETNCNPYMTKIGAEKTEALRLNVAQIFNGVGTVVGPLVGGAVLPAAVAGAPDAGQIGMLRALVMEHIRIVYASVAGVLIAVLLLFLIVKLPAPPGDTLDTEESNAPSDNVFRHPHFTLGVVALFLFIGAQTGVLSLLGTFALAHWKGLSAGDAAAYLSLGSALFAIGRIATTPLMAKFDAAKILGLYMATCAALMFVAFLGLGRFSVWAVIVSLLFISIGYPTIFSLSLKGIQGRAVKTGSSALVMSIVGAAIIPLAMGVISDRAGIDLAFLALMLPFLYVAWYAFFGSRIGLQRSPALGNATAA